MDSRRLILIAEDEPDAAHLVQFRLRRCGYRTLIAEDGLAALNTALAERPALLILDLMMPKLHGLEVCRMLKASPITGKMPILILTAVGGADEKLQGFQRGADDYLTKPYDMPELLARVQVLVGRAGA